MERCCRARNPINRLPWHLRTWLLRNARLTSRPCACTYEWSKAKCICTWCTHQNGEITWRLGDFDHKHGCWYQKGWFDYFSKRQGFLPTQQSLEYTHSGTEDKKPSCKQQFCARRNLTLSQPIRRLRRWPLFKAGVRREASRNTPCMEP